MTRRKVLHEATTVKVDKSTQKSLIDLKQKRGFGTYDEAINYLLDKFNKSRNRTIDGVAYNTYMRVYMNRRNHLKSLKSEIRRKYDFRCIICDSMNMTSRHQIPVHHKDWDPNNNDEDNLVTLCPKHHSYVHRGWLIV